MSELERLIGDLRAEGRLDSVGRFSIDAGRALDRLQRDAVPDPQLYLVHLVEAAVLNGATFVEVQPRRGGCVVESDGPPWNASELRELVPGLVGGRWSTDHRLHPLALAVVGSLGRVAGEVLVASASRGILRVARYLPGGAEVLEREVAAPPRQRVEVRFLRSRGWLGLLTGQPEASLLRNHCRHCTADLRLNGAPLAAPAPLPPCLVLSVLRHPELPLRFQEDQNVLARMGASPGAFAAALTLGWRTSLPSLRIQHGGRLFPLEVDLGPTATAFVAARNLRTDLGRTGLLRDDRFEAIVEALRGEVEAMRLHLAARFNSLSPRQQGWAAPHLHLLARDLEAAGEEAAAAELAAKVRPFGAAARAPGEGLPPV